MLNKFLSRYWHWSIFGIIFIFSIFFLSLNLRIWSTSQVKGNDAKELSPRVKEFVTTHHDLQWINSEEILHGESRLTILEPNTSCFKVKKQLKFRSARINENDNHCVFLGSLDIPRASLTIVTRKLSLTSLSLKEVPDVNYRLNNPQLYKSANVLFSDPNRFDEYLFITAEQELAFFARKNDKLIVIGLYQLPRVTTDSYSLLRSFIDAYELL